MTSENDFEVVESEFDSDDSQEDPSFDIFEETQSRFSDLSIKKKSRTRVAVEANEDENENVDCVEIVAPEFDASDQKSFEIVQKIIEDDMVEKLKVEQCKLYLRKHGLRLTGKKDILIHRIKEHISIMNGEGEHKYPASSFVMNCKGDACTGDVVMFEQNVYEMFNIASRSATGPPCGTRVVAGRIVKESYGAAKQQHTFTIEVLWSKGVKPLPPLHPLLIKGRNLYRLKTMRQRWENESERQKILSEKHSRGNAARSNRAARLHEKEMKKALRERTSKGNIQNKNQAKKRTTSPTRPVINTKNPTKQDLHNDSIQHEARNRPAPSAPHPHPYTGVLGRQPFMNHHHHHHHGASYKENIHSNMLRNAVGWQPNGPSRNTFRAEQNRGFYPSKPFQNSPQSHSFHQDHLPREVQKLPQSHSFQQDHLPREVQNLPQSHSFQQDHLPREVQNLPQSHSFQQAHLPREVQNLPQSHSFQQAHLPQSHSFQQDHLPREVQKLPQSHSFQQDHLPREVQNLPQSHSFQQDHLPREVQNLPQSHSFQQAHLPQSHSFQQDHLPREVQKLPQSHSFQQGHLPREVQNLPQSHSFQQDHLPREVQNLPQSHSFQQAHLPQSHNCQKGHQGQRQQLHRYYPQGR